MLTNTNGRVAANTETEDALANIRGVSCVLGHLACMGDNAAVFSDDEHMFLMLSRVLDDAAAVLGLRKGTDSDGTAAV